jgi:methanogenic corrinoid protein MtbC1
MTALHALVSTEAVASFRENLPRLVALVNDSFAVDSRVFPSEIPVGDRAFLADLQSFWGETYLAACEFGLVDSLEGEFRWLAGVLASRGFGAGIASKALEAWIMGIHGTLPPSHARELAPPLQALKGLSEADGRHDTGSIPLLGVAQKAFLDLLLRKDRRGAAKLAVSSLSKNGAEGLLEVWEDLLAPALREVGRLWQDNRLSAADEHAATEICRYVLFRLSDGLRPDGPAGVVALVGCVEGEEHALPVEALAELLRLRGWDVRLTGRSAPTTDIVSTVLRERPKVLVLGVRLIRSLPGARSVLKAVREGAPEIRILAGGQAAVAAAPVLGEWANAVAGSLGEGFAQAVALGRGRA